MEFFTQTAFAFAVIGYIFCINERKKGFSTAVFIFSMICLAAYIIPYLYLLSKGALDWFKIVMLAAVIIFSGFAIKYYLSLP